MTSKAIVLENAYFSVNYARIENMLIHQQDQFLSLFLSLCLSLFSICLSLSHTHTHTHTHPQKHTPTHTRTQGCWRGMRLVGGCVVFCVCVGVGGGGVW